MANIIQSGERAPVVTNCQFKDFGVLETGRQSKTSTATAVILNILILAFVILVGAAAKKTIDENHKLTMLTMPVVKPLPPPEPPKITIHPLPKPPVTVKVDPPKIKLPDVKPIEAPKPTEAKMAQPAPIIAAPAPRKVVAPAAPQVVNLARPMAASVVNNSQHPTAVALGSPNNPIAPSNRPATSAINLGQRGMAGMPASNTGGGPAATAVNLGSGSPGGQALAGNGTHAVQGIKLGVNGGTPNSTGHVAGPVNLGQNQPPAVQKPQATLVAVAQSAPKVLFKPTPAYTQEAAALHLSGAVAIKIRVSASGSVTVLAITSPLGHGLDQSAERAIQGTRFSPAVDASGRPVDWEGVVRVNFQLAS